MGQSARGKQGPGEEPGGPTLSLDTFPAPARGRGGERAQAQDGSLSSVNGQSPLPPKVLAQQRDTELPQLPPLIHEARLCVSPTSRRGLLPHVPLLPVHHHAAPPPPPPPSALFTPGAAARASSNLSGLPIVAPPGSAALPASLYFALCRKINCLYLTPAILTLFVCVLGSADRTASSPTGLLDSCQATLTSVNLGSAAPVLTLTH